MLERLQEALDQADRALRDHARVIAAKDKIIDDLRGRAGPELPGSDGEQANPGEEDDGAVLGCSEDDLHAVRMAGRRCCILHMPWMHQGDVLFGNNVYTCFKAIIFELEAIRGIADDVEAVAEAENAWAEFWANSRVAVADPVMVMREIVSHLDIGLAKQWFEPWFKRQFKLGMRDLQLEAANKVADHHYLALQLTDEEFGEHHGLQRCGPGAQRCSRTTPTYLTHVGATMTNERITSRCFIHRQCLGPRSFCLRARPLSALTYGDQSFDMVTTTANYMELYEKTLELLHLLRRKHPVAFNKLIEYYNRSVLPHIHPPLVPGDPDVAGMTAGRWALYQEMMAEPDEEDEGEGLED
ncbi:hypothetical protein FRC08_006174 [Ceratobasidium sp. 394]|nr:hypothetical protein FRC08_006174 [Ceratobasidium sp. 394]